MADDTDRWFDQAVDATLEHVRHLADDQAALERRREAFQHLRSELTLTEIERTMKARLVAAGLSPGELSGVGVGAEWIRKTTHNPGGRKWGRPGRQ